MNDLKKHDYELDDIKQALNSCIDSNYTVVIHKYFQSQNVNNQNNINI